jgi:glycosyltransferase involved in cell wall biosynthesis
VIPAVPAVKVQGKLLLDDKALSGLELYRRYWPGSIRCIFRELRDGSLGEFSSLYSQADLPFEICTIPATSSVSDELIRDAAVISASGDIWYDFPLAERAKKLGIPLCFTIENIPETRLRIMRLNENARFRRLKSYVWHAMTEFERRNAFRLSSGLQSNGTPAADEYRRLSSNILTFFDTRLSASQMITDAELAEKQDRILQGFPLRMAFSGRLEPIKGADELIEIAKRLSSKDLEFTLDIFGSGTLESMMKRRVAQLALQDKVRFHGAIDFDAQLVPRMRANVDLFLCCHPQSDPSCTYLETLGCGVPIVGYDNRAWRGILRSTDVGWSSAMGAADEFVSRVIDVDRNRSELSRKVQTARDFARSHSSEVEFERRVNHLLGLARRESLPFEEIKS